MQLIIDVDGNPLKDSFYLETAYLIALSYRRSKSRNSDKAIEVSLDFVFCCIGISKFVQKKEQPPITQINYLSLIIICVI